MAKIPHYYAAKAWLPSAVSGAVRKIRQSRIEFDSFAVRGVSGMVFGAKLSHVMQKNLIVVRKTVDGSHATRMVEGYEPYRYLFLDDFIGMGITRRKVQDHILEAYPAAKMIGSYLYLDDELLIASGTRPKKVKVKS